MNKQKNMMELIIYLMLLVMGIVFLIKGYHKKDYDMFPETNTTTEPVNEVILPNEDITYDYEFSGDE